MKGQLIEKLSKRYVPEFLQRSLKIYTFLDLLYVFQRGPTYRLQIQSSSAVLLLQNISANNSLSHNTCDLKAAAIIFRFFFQPHFHKLHSLLINFKQLFTNLNIFLTNPIRSILPPIKKIQQFFFLTHTSRRVTNHSIILMTYSQNVQFSLTNDS